MITQAFILGAGLGKRMRPLTDDRPKPMVHVNGKPIIDYVLEKLASENIDRCVINTHYMADVLEDHVKNKSLPFDVVFSREENLLDTGGGLKKGLSLLDTQKPTFVVSGDSIWEDSKNSRSLKKLADFWDNDTMDIALLLQDIKTMADGVGDYDLVNNMPIRNRDKNGQYMWTSIRILHPRIFENETEDVFSFLKDLDTAEDQGRLHAQIHDGQWHHLSTPSDVEALNERL